MNDKALIMILPQLLQRSKRCRGHYSTKYHATSVTTHFEKLRTLKIQRGKLIVYLLQIERVQKGTALFAVLYKNDVTDRST